MSTQSRTQFARLVITLTMLASFVPAYADEQMRMGEAEGAWLSMWHSDSMVSQPDVCIAATQTGDLAFRADGNGLQLIVLNKKWSIPDGTVGTVGITVGDYKQDVSVEEASSIQMRGNLPSDTATKLFTAMDKGNALTYTIGKKPILVSLLGSTKVLNDFQSCATRAGLDGLRANPIAGSNPFSGD